MASKDKYNSNRSSHRPKVKSSFKSFAQLQQVLEEMTIDNAVYHDDDSPHIGKHVTDHIAHPHIGRTLNLMSDEKKSRKQKTPLKLILDAHCIQNVRLDLPN
jgi:hypothetical protein